MSLIDQTEMLINRLERIPVDSTWARRAGGHRGALLHWRERFEISGQAGLTEQELEQFANLVITGFRLLENAAKERVR